MLKLRGKKIFTFYAEIFILSKPVSLEVSHLTLNGSIFKSSIFKKKSCATYFTGSDGGYADEADGPGVGEKCCGGSN